MILYFLFFKDTVATDIYTYLHTLSLHDSLPISGSAPPRRTAPRRSRSRPTASGSARAAEGMRAAAASPPAASDTARQASSPSACPRTHGRSASGTLSAPAGCGSSASSAPPQRSEEHTSELQSLMRISYAVFCLKKKKKNNTITKRQDSREQYKDKEK